MHVTTKTYGRLTCDIETDEAKNLYVGTLKFNRSPIGTITSSDLQGIDSQANELSDLVEQGAMVRRGVVMKGYHDGELPGDVLLIDGKVIGSWKFEGDEWCQFMTVGGTERTYLEASSPWALHDQIADWVDSSQ